MKITIRHERIQEGHEVDRLIRDAFWGQTRPTCDEHYLAHLLRADAAFVPELNFVAESQGRLIGSILYSKAAVVDDQGSIHPVLTFGPLSVLPQYHRSHGVGTALMQHSIREAKKLGYAAIVFYGHPDYYPRFGFQNAACFGITSSEGYNFDALMAMPLYKGGLEGITGRFCEPAPFHRLDAGAVAAFDRSFAPKQPAQMVPISLLLDRLPVDAHAAFADSRVDTLQGLYRFSGREMLRWAGIGLPQLEIINQTLQAHGMAPKLPPSSPILGAAQECQW